ncbi:MAG: PAC2 family protein, partial [Caldilineaceae bacterium]|nr:PAC2 family protein [Caldilineaceae bacterium]
MDELVELWEIPETEELYMIAGWSQWADAGSVSSGLPDYLIDHLSATKIGEIKPGSFYLFQIPGMHHLLRPEVKFEEGYSSQIKPRANEFYYHGNEKVGLIIFRGEEPHMNAEQYADALFAASRKLGVRRIALVGGVYGAMPYEKDRE